MILNSGFAKKNSALDFISFSKARESVRSKRGEVLSKFSRKNNSGGKGKGKKKNFSAKAKTILIKSLVIFTITFLFSILLGIIFLISVVSIYSKDLPNIDDYLNQSNNEAKPTVIVDRNNKELYRLQGSTIKEKITIKQVPDKLKWAILSTEDKNFYQENGLSYDGLVRAGICIIAHQGNSDSCPGGSTITQQLVKDTTQETGRTVERKLKESIVAMNVAQKYTPDQTLEYYLNIVPEGGNLVGIGAGSKYLFGQTDMSKLTLGQMAILAGIPNRPTVYSPWGGSGYDPTLAQQRANHVLDDMLSNKDQSGVTQEEVDKAKAEIPQDLQAILPQTDHKEAPHYVDYVISQLDQMYADKVSGDQRGSDYLRDKGYTVVSAVDLDVQNQLQDSIKNGVNSAQFQKAVGAQNGAGVLIDPQTGEVIAMVGSKDFNATSTDPRFNPQFNAALSPRNMGSSTKPPVYLSAFINGYNPSSTVDDMPIDLRADGSSQAYYPRNFGNDFGHFGQFESMRKALSESMNVPAVSTYHLVGPDKFADTYIKLSGWQPFRDQVQGPAAPLGGANIPLLYQVNAYATMASGGVYHDPKFILQIKDLSGAVVYDNTKVQGTQVIDPKYVYLINSMNMTYHLCSHSYSDGIWQYGQYTDPLFAQMQKSMDVGCKTGTAGTSGDSIGDVAFMSYTPTFVLGMWGGNSCGPEQCGFGSNQKLSATGESLYDYVYRPFLQSYLPKIKPARFTVPNGVRQATTCSVTGRAYDPVLCPAIGGRPDTDWVADAPKPEDMVVKVAVTDCNGAIKLASPSDISNGYAKDAYYLSYKFPNPRIQSEINADYAKKNSTAPADQCTIDRSTSAPTVTIISPATGTTFSPGDTISINAAVTSDLALSNVQIFVDNVLQKTVVAPDTGYQLNYVLPTNISAGAHVITVIAQNVNQHQGRDDKTVQVNVKQVTPTQPQTITPTPTSIVTLTPIPTITPV